MKESMFASQGYEIVRGVISEARCAELADLLSSERQAGDRNGLLILEIQQLGRQLQNHPLLTGALPVNSVAVQCTLFDKSPAKNWLVAMHQDLSIPVANRVADPLCSGWSKKEGVHYTQPPLKVLQSLVAVRIHLDECGNDNGPLRVVPGSHLRGRWTAAELESERATLVGSNCPVPRGAALLMSPLILHASSKANRPDRRRVLHFLFGPQELPCGLKWPGSECAG